MIRIFDSNYKSGFLNFHVHQYDRLIKENDWKLIIKRILWSWMCLVDCPKQIDTTFLFFKSLRRDDYDILFNSIVKECRYDKVQVEISYKFGFSGLLKSISLLTKISLPRSSHLTLTKWIYVHSFLLRYAKLLEKAKNWTCETCVVFADMQPADNLIVQKFIKQGVLTVTMQHGLYVDYSKSPNINEVNYKNVVSNYFLAWGEETANLIRRYINDVHVVVCGKPVSIPPPSRHKSEVFTVIFDQKIFRDSNSLLLNIAYSVARSLDLKVNLRIHPSDHLNNYKVDHELVILNDPVHLSKFILGHTTSLMFELIRSGYKVYKLQS